MRRGGHKRIARLALAILLGALAVGAAELTPRAAAAFED